MKRARRLLMGAAAAAMLAERRHGARRRSVGKGLTMYMQMGGNAGDGATLARQTGAAQAAATALGVDTQGAVLRLGAGDDDQPVQGGGRRQADLHRDHGPSRQRRLPRSGQAGGRARASSSPTATRR